MFKNNEGVIGVKIKYLVFACTIIPGKEECFLGKRMSTNRMIATNKTLNT